MRISDLRASHLPAIGDRVIATRADGVEFLFTRESDQEGAFYRVRPVEGLADFSVSHLSATAKTLREVVREARNAVVGKPDDSDDKADAARKAIAVAVSTYEDSAAYDFTLPLSCAAFLATRKEAPSICEALGVTPEDCVVEEAEEDGDVSGWTYLDRHGEIAYLVRYPNGKVGAELGGYQVYADTLEEAERQLCAYTECTDVTGLPSVYAVAESKLDTEAAHAVLTLVYSHWLREQGHPLEGCAYELLVANEWTDNNERLTDEQRLFVFKFNEAWDAA